MLDERGVWHDNISCRRCRRRHPADWTCEEATRIAQAQGQPVVHVGHEESEKQEWLDAFIERAGFRFGWWNLESWARRMAEQAYEERTR